QYRRIGAGLSGIAVDSAGDRGRKEIQCSRVYAVNDPSTKFLSYAQIGITADDDAVFKTGELGIDPAGLRLPSAIYDSRWQFTRRRGGGRDSAGRKEFEVS